MECSHCGDGDFPMRPGTDGQMFCIDSESCEHRKTGRTLMTAIHAAIGTAICTFAHELAEEFARTYRLRNEQPLDADDISKTIDRAFKRWATDPTNPYKIPPP